MVSNSYTRLYHIWQNMKSRCYYSKQEKYKRYGGRGIKVCEDWQDFTAFKEWAIKNGYSDNLSLDRINNDGDYEPQNCRWADMRTQQNNRRNNRFVTINGETRTISEWSRISGIKRSTLSSRIQRGWEGDLLRKE